ncbi:DUF2808 domain-containing protein [Iningainema tapete]|uniref:DUF2808 domain-containing protein n=1 Tax=Iningainema tapete BLCC-T55 TaxID=2748662 RepID=A0A8J7C9I1_9CYAN|nr:DUF2808 domain-containing protein [Iningainema tapete]MBD2775966.1 DUF2808 domain-containing protein [Iningainema tapete BLCC-T55]
MRIAFLFGTAITCLAAVGGYTANLSQAVQLRDGRVYFVQPPRLVEAVTTYKEIYVWGATYYFTMDLPENAGEPLQKVTFNQHEGVDRIRFDVKDSYAFVGERSSRGEKLAIKEATSDRKTRTVSLTFDPPVSPGKTITIALKPVQNPTIQGVYLFGVTAFPPGEKAYGQFLGYGRLQFYGFGIDGI